MKEEPHTTPFTVYEADEAQLLEQEANQMIARALVLEFEANDEIEEEDGMDPNFLELDITKESSLTPQKRYSLQPTNTAGQHLIEPFHEV